jgi:hypothetical protein
MEYTYKSRPVMTYESTVVEFTLIDEEGREHEYREWQDTKLGHGLEYWNGTCWEEVEEQSEELQEMLSIMEDPIRNC